jgi:hypothetical protein
LIKINNDPNGRFYFRKVFSRSGFWQWVGVDFPAINCCDHATPQEEYLYMSNENNSLGKAVALGICFGAAIGAVLHNFALGASIGLVFGAAFGSRTNKRNDDSN